MKGLIVLLAILPTGIICFPQQNELTLNEWSARNPIEKIYIHFDRNEYIAGQTIWFKAYVYSDFLPDTRSTNLYVEFFNGSSGLVNRLALPLFGGYANGQIELPDTLPGGSYLLRAYTPTMLNHDNEFLYHKTFFIFGRNRKAEPVSITQQASRLEFFPEGGNFVTGLSNSIAFKATNEKGLPVNVAGIVQNDKGEKVAEFSSYHDGMGTFDLTPEENRNYYAIFNEDRAEVKYKLPVQVPRGIVLRLISSGITKSFEILQKRNDPVFTAAYMIGQLQHHVVFKKTFTGQTDEITGIIPTDKLSSGILHVTVFNKDGMPLAERLTFVDNKEYVQAGELLIDTLDFGDRKKNHFTLALNDTVQGSFSVSVTDPAFDLVPTRGQNIYSGLLLTSDLAGYIHNPSYYFSSSGDSVQNALDLVMMTNGWRRFSWNTLATEARKANKFTDPGYINLSGKINLQSTRKPFADKDLLAFIVSAFGKNVQMLHTDSEGKFNFDSIVFYGNARLLFTDIRGKKSKSIDVKLGGDSLHRDYSLRRPVMPGNSSGGFVTDREKKILDEYNAVMKAEGLMLEEITVRSRKKSALEELEEKYVSGPFAGAANSTLDVTNESMLGYRDIFDFLKLRVPGLQVLKDPHEPGYMIKYRQTAAISSMGELPMTIFLNEVPSDADAVASIPPQEIALIKVYGTFVGATGNGAGGVLAIYTKKDADLAALQSPGDLSGYQGYSIIKEFYSPDYSVNRENHTDNRMTLCWKPALLVDGINPKIPISFYNNDRTRQFKIVVEGVTADGKLLMIEKTIGAKKAF